MPSLYPAENSGLAYSPAEQAVAEAAVEALAGAAVGRVELD